MFKKLELKEERDLEHLVVHEPESIEEGLVYLAHQRKVNGKYIDVLAVDTDGVLVVIELKIGQDDDMLIQALEYYDYISSNRDRVANEYEKRAKIVTAEDPRIILVASGFSDRLKRAARYFEPNTTLMEYAYIEGKGGERGLFCREIQFDGEDVYSPALSLENVFSYINQPKVKQAAEKAHADLCKLGANVEPNARDGYLRYKCKNRIVGDLYPKRTFFHVAWLEGEGWESEKISSLSDWGSRKNKVLKAFAKRYRAVGGE